MNEQDALLPDENGQTTPTRFNPNDHGLWKSFVGADGHIIHDKWMMAIANGQFVGTCRRCGDYMVPARPDDRLQTRRDYEATCRNPSIGKAIRGDVQVDIACAYTILAVNGRTFAGTTSARRSRKG